jgi:pyruvate kinase
MLPKDSFTPYPQTLLPTHSVMSRAEATDVANAVLDGTDGVLLGAETLRGKYPAITVKTVLAICRQAEEVFDYSGHYEWLTLQGEMVCKPYCYLCSLHMCQLICVACSIVIFYC